MSSGVTIQRLDSGYYRAQGKGPCEWAQWQAGLPLRDEDFFPEASEAFRRALRAALASPDAGGEERGR
mgnify:CR=1 FL=1